MRIEIAQIKVKFYIRVQLEQERIDWFHELISKGVELDPIDVMPGDFPGEYVLLEGRHRLMAYQHRGEDDIECKVHKKMSLEEAYAFALKANYGGALPPTEEDMFHMAESMIMDKIGKSKIILAFGAIPTTIAEQFYSTARKRIHYRAVAAVIDLQNVQGLSREEALARINPTIPFRIDEKDVTAENARRSKKRKDYGKRYERMKADLGTRVRVFQKQNNKMFNDLFEGFAKNEVDIKMVKDILGHFGKLIGNIVKMSRDVEKRFELRNFGEPLFGKVRITTRAERRKDRKARLQKLKEEENL